MRRICQNPNDLLNLKAYNYPHCDSVVYLDKDRDLKKAGFLKIFIALIVVKKHLTNS